MNINVLENLNILIADDHVLVRQGLHSLIASYKINLCIDEVETGEQAWKYIQIHEPDIAILDISMGKLNGIDVCKHIVRRRLKTKVIFLSMYDGINVIDYAFSVGAKGYIPKSEAFSALLEAISRVADGEEYLNSSLKLALDAYRNNEANNQLTNREKEVISQISLGHTNKQIASDLFISVKTVENHRAKIMKKLGLKTTAQLVRFAITESLAF
ncbi:response regulator [Pseudoalteromonas luteoviolacea]|uniref:LuxR family transcriptional regulator n=1 Tax=Pseudoalteromonas luteoviolacea NCIMB 1942 TaxID=1365253 RepID=A0A161YBF4_9GAMM|nr:response regulator transcription factor [Pseudoalteromonas luteoviolacea]KZN55840.1 hypothetical protein N482_05020 [Pseudoalteromonas luteoviolacea NCIMB 1942]